MNKLIVLLGTTFLLTIFFSHQAQAQDCRYWHSKVGIQNVEYAGKQLDEKDPQTITEGIGCLLQLEGIKTRGSISGATHNRVSIVHQVKTPVEITALHYISYLFYQRFDYANEVALHERKEDAPVNSKKAIRKAYRSYRKWYKKVKVIGIEEARRRNLDPLKGSGVKWY